MLEKLFKAFGYVRLIENVLCSQESLILDRRLHDVHSRLTKLELTTEGLYDQVLRKLQKRQIQEEPKKKFFGGLKHET